MADSDWLVRIFDAWQSVKNALKEAFSVWTRVTAVGRQPLFLTRPPWKPYRAFRASFSKWRFTLMSAQGPVSISTTDCPTGRRTILPCYLPIAEWSDARSDAYWNTPRPLCAVQPSGDTLRHKLIESSGQIVLMYYVSFPVCLLYTWFRSFSRPKPPFLHQSTPALGGTPVVHRTEMYNLHVLGAVSVSTTQ